MATTKIPLELSTYAPDADGATLELQTTDTTVTDGSVLGKIEFKAPKEASGTDALLVGASIEAVAEGTFAADNNATELVFKTGASEAAAQKMVLTSAGRLGIGTASPDRTLSIKHASQAEIGFKTGSVSNGALIYYNDSENQLLLRAQESGEHIAFQTGGTTERMRIDSSGNVGIGTTPATNVRLDIRSNAAATLGDFRNASATGFGLYVAAGDTSSQYAFRAADYQNNALFSVMGDGNVGIGTTSPNNKLDVNGGIVCSPNTDGKDTFELSTNASDEGRFRIKNVDTTTVQIRAGGDSYFNGGVVLFGKSSTNVNTAGGYIDGGEAIFTIAGSGNTYLVRSTDTNAYTFFVGGDGEVHSAQGTAMTNLSDERLKENIVDIDTGLTEVLALKPRKFDWKDGQGSGKKNLSGFIAQEVEPILPDLIGGFLHDTLEDAKSLRTGDMIPTLVKAIQELEARLKTLEDA